MLGFASLRKSIRRLSTPLTVTVVLGLISGSARAGEVKVAVAANFTEAAQEIGATFEKQTGHKPIFSFGASGQFYTQVTQGAPFEVFLSADKDRPQKAVDEGLAVEGSLFTYATGRLVLFSQANDLVTGPDSLKTSNFTKLAIANPGTAPYGAAAVETMKRLGVYDAISTRIVQGNNISQTYQFIATGAAELGFVALSQVIGKGEGSQWIVPEELHTMIAQDAVLLKTGEANEAAKAFLQFLKGDEAKAIKQKYGYGAGSSPAS
jgi:molybdate transport system substrate-binding protein